MTRGITRNPEILGGAPCIAGSRLAVASVLGMLAHRLGTHRSAASAVMRDYPGLTLDGLTAAVEFAAQLVGSDRAGQRDRIVELQRRVQAAESAARVTVEECRRAGDSLGRQLARWAARDAERRAELIGKRLARITELHGGTCLAVRPADCPVCVELAQPLEGEEPAS